MEKRAEKVQVERRWGPATAGCDGGGQKAMQKGTKFEGGTERRVAATVRCQSAVESPHILDVGPTRGWRFVKRNIKKKTFF